MGAKVGGVKTTHFDLKAIYMTNHQHGSSAIH